MTAPLNIWAVGRNNPDHAKELGNAVPEEPMIFLKAGSCYSAADAIRIPEWTKEIHHELEIALRFGPDLEFDAMALSLDLTDRDLQGKLKSKGHPWTLAKSFTGACPVSKFLPIPSDLSQLRFHLFVNDSLKQNGCLREMLFSPEELRRFVLPRLPVRPGDLLLTGTPAGVGPLKAGDRVKAQLLRENPAEMLLECHWRVER